VIILESLLTTIELRAVFETAVSVVKISSILKPFQIHETLCMFTKIWYFKSTFSYSFITTIDSENDAEWMNEICRIESLKKEKKCSEYQTINETRHLLITTFICPTYIFFIYFFPGLGANPII